MCGGASVRRRWWSVVTRWRSCINSAPVILWRPLFVFLPLATMYEVVTGIERGRLHGGKQAFGMLLTSRAFVCNVRGQPPAAHRGFAGQKRSAIQANTDEKRSQHHRINRIRERARWNDGWPGASLAGWAGFPRKLVSFIQA